MAETIFMDGKSYFFPEDPTPVAGECPDCAEQGRLEFLVAKTRSRTFRELIVRCGACGEWLGSSTPLEVSVKEQVADVLREWREDLATERAYDEESEGA